MDCTARLRQIFLAAGGERGATFLYPSLKDGRRPRCRTTRFPMNGPTSGIKGNRILFAAAQIERINVPLRRRLDALRHEMLRVWAMPRFDPGVYARVQKEIALIVETTHRQVEAATFPPRPVTPPVYRQSPTGLTTRAAGKFGRL